MRTPSSKLLSSICECVRYPTYNYCTFHFLALDAFVRTNCRAIAMMFVRSFVCLSVCLSGTSVHCDHTVHVTADVSSRSDSTMSNVLGTLTPKHVHLLPTVFFLFHREERWGMDVQTRRIIKRIKISSA